MRHALDFEPFLVILMALAWVPLPASGAPAGVRSPIGEVLIGWSCLVGTWGVWFWNSFYRR